MIKLPLTKHTFKESYIISVLWSLFPDWVGISFRWNFLCVL